mmetsp:Transcript_26999/g.57200  ORF Transcript_26999/g.57200 Transcript_26999/m.57200 type:complete len:244 (-) Transcript_26999:749-1480(-)
MLSLSMARPLWNKVSMARGRALAGAASAPWRRKLPATGMNTFWGATPARQLRRALQWGSEASLCVTTVSRAMRSLPRRPAPSRCQSPKPSKERAHGEKRLMTTSPVAIVRLSRVAAPAQMQNSRQRSTAASGASLCPRIVRVIQGLPGMPRCPAPYHCQSPTSSKERAHGAKSLMTSPAAIVRLAQVAAHVWVQESGKRSTAASNDAQMEKPARDSCCMVASPLAKSLAWTAMMNARKPPAGW